MENSYDHAQGWLVSLFKNRKFRFGRRRNGSKTGRGAGGPILRETERGKFLFLLEMSDHRRGRMRAMAIFDELLSEFDVAAEGLRPTEAAA
jgi:hypothetical protein